MPFHFVARMRVVHLVRMRVRSFWRGVLCGASAAVALTAPMTVLSAQQSPAHPAGADSLAVQMRGAAVRDDAAAMLRLWTRGVALPTEGLGPNGRALRAALDTTSLPSAPVRADPRFRAPVHWAAWVLTGDVF